MNIFIILTLIFLATSASALSVKEKKQNFRKIMAPAVENVYQELYSRYIEAEHYMNSSHKYNVKMINDMKKKYSVKTNEELLMRLKPHPKSIAMAQAAMESSWATSRFFRKANNIFGVWSFNKNEPRIAASQTRGAKKIWLKKYNTLEDSIKDYYKVISRGRAYKEFKKLKMKTENPYELVKKLDKYSEIRAKYTKELSRVIRYNKFYLYDK